MITGHGMLHWAMARVGAVAAGAAVGAHLQVPQDPVLAPRLGQLHGRPPQLPGVLLQPLLQALKQS